MNWISIVFIGVSLAEFLSSGKSTRESGGKNATSSYDSTDHLPDRKITQAKNNRPVVTIIEPENNSLHSLKSLIPYAVTVSDVEDGESKYDEIPSNQVFLEVKYASGIPPFDPVQKMVDEPVGLTLMKSSDCFTCHQFKTPLIGPSFKEIANRYSAMPSASQLLSERVREGSTGVWSDLVMPAHSDLNSDAAIKIIHWILENGNDPGINYMVGSKGTLKLEVPPGESQGYFMLKASYMDKGRPDNPHEKLRGEDLVILRYH